MPPAYDQKNDSTASRAPASAASLNGNVVGGDDRPGRGRRRARSRGRRSAVALLHDRGARRHADQRPAGARRRHQGRAGAHARQRRRSDPAGRRSAHVLSARRAAVAVPRPHAEAADGAPRDRDRRGEGRPRPRPGPARAGRARLGAAGGRRAGSQQAIEQLRRRAAAAHDGRRDRRPPRQLGQGPQGRRSLPRGHRHQDRLVSDAERLGPLRLEPLLGGADRHRSCAPPRATFASRRSSSPRWRSPAPTEPSRTAWAARSRNVTCAPRPARWPPSAACRASPAHPVTRRSSSRSS